MAVDRHDQHIELYRIPPRRHLLYPGSGIRTVSHLRRKTVCPRHLPEKVHTPDGIVTFGLRVMECRKCHHTHRELPCGIVPYKRHCAEIIADCQGETCPDSIGEFSAFLRMKVWIKWFLEYAEKVMTGLAAAYDDLSVPGNLTSAERLMYFVRLVANSDFWVQDRSALRM